MNGSACERSRHIETLSSACALHRLVALFASSVLSLLVFIASLQVCDLCILLIDGRSFFVFSIADLAEVF
jgi:hypothetical protein